MPRTNRVFQLLLLIGILILTALSLPAQNPELLHHFDYDQKAPLKLKQPSVQHRTHADVCDITYDSPKGAVVPAYVKPLPAAVIAAIPISISRSPNNV